MRAFNLIDVHLSLEQHYQELPLLRELDPHALPEEREGRQEDNPHEPSMPYHTVRRWEEAVVGQIRIERSYSLEQLFHEFHQITEQSAPMPPRFIVLGPPGSGKSTLLEYLEYLVGKSDPRIPAQVKVPIRIELRRWERETPNAPLEEYLLKRYAALPNAPKNPAQWREILEAGEALVAFDGVDEVGNWAEFAPYLREALAATRNCPTILTGRTLSRARFTELGAELPIFYIGELNETQRNALIHTYFTAKGNPQRAEQLIEQLDALPQMSALALNPLLLGLICFTVADERRVQLPATRSEVYERALEKMLAQERGISVNYPDGVELSLSDKLELASYAATELFRQMACAHSLLMDDETLLRALRTAAQQAGFSKPRELANALKRDLTHNTRLLSGDEAEGYNFLHLTLLEYLAARGLALRLESGDEQAWGILQSHCDYPRWREVCVFLAGCLAQRNQRQTLHQWIEWLCDESRDDLLRHRLTLAMQSLAEIPANKRAPYTRLIDSVSEQCFAFWKELYANGVAESVPHVSDALQAIMRVQGKVEEQPFDEYLADALRSSDSERVRFALETLEHLGIYGSQPTVMDALTRRLPSLLRDARMRWAAVKAIGALGTQAQQMVADNLALHLTELLRDSDWRTREATAQAIDALEARARQVAAENLAQHLPELLHDWFTRRATVEVVRRLAMQATPEVVTIFAQHLPELLRDGYRNTSEATVKAIGALGAQAQQVVAHALAQHLPELLSDRNTGRAAVEAISALGRHATPEVVTIFAQHLPELLRDSDWRTRAATVKAIGALGAQAQQVVADALTQHLPELLRDGNTRGVAVKAIGALGRHATPEVVTIFAQHLPELLRDGNTHKATIETIQTLGRQAQQVVADALAQPLPQLLRDRNMRWTTVEAIGALRMQAQQVVADTLAQHLTELLRDSDWFTRGATVKAIGALGTLAWQVAADALTQHLPELLCNRNTRGAAVKTIRMLGRQVTPEVVTIFARHLPALLRDSDWRTRKATVRAIGALGRQVTPEVVNIFAQHLPQLLSEGDDTRWATVETIGALGRQVTPEVVNIFAQHLPQLLGDWLTRGVTVRTIGALGAQAQQVVADALAQHLPQLLRDADMRGATVETIGALGAQAQQVVADTLAQHLPELLDDANTRWATIRAIEALADNPSLLSALCEVILYLDTQERWRVLHLLNTQHNIRLYSTPSGLIWKRVDECGEES